MIYKTTAFYRFDRPARNSNTHTSSRAHRFERKGMAFLSHTQAQKQNSSEPPYKQKETAPFGQSLLFLFSRKHSSCALFRRTLPLRVLPEGDYIMPPMPPCGIAGAGVSSFLSTMTHSVVRNIPAIEAAFSRATRVTLAGSTTPAARRFS